MPLSWNEMRDRATAFAAKLRHTKDEDADAGAKSLLHAFFEVFAVRPRKVASFEKRVEKLDGRDGLRPAQVRLPLQRRHRLQRLPLAAAA